ncbi:MAG: hypothetical protein WC890_05210 [Candidatus Margulisiibacteriota bacterium]
MKKSFLVAITLLVLVLGSECLAFNTAVIGGMRNGLALGMMLENGLSRSATFRLGVEASTSNSPGIVFVGGKWFLGVMDSSYPIYMSGGLVGYMGNNSEAGPYISLVFENLLDMSPLFLETGIDIVNSGRLQLQIGYYL